MTLRGHHLRLLSGYSSPTVLVMSREGHGTV